MPYARRKPRKKFKRKRRNKKTSKLSDKRINTLVELRCQEISKKEIAKQVQRLLYRQYLFGPYDPLTNLFTAGTRVSYNGLIQALARIQKRDNSTAVTVAPLAQPYQTPATWENPGGNVIADITGADGFRTSNMIRIKGLRLQMRVLSNLFTFNPAVPTTPQHEHSYLYWMVCATVYDGSELINSVPIPSDMLSIPRFGYNKKLDEVFLDNTKYEKKIKVFGRGVIKMPCSTQQTNVSFINKWIDMKNQRVIYDDYDQNGAQVQKWKPFIVFRSSIPEIVANHPYMPLLNACCTLHYTDAV